MDAELKKLMDEKRLLDKEIDALEVEILSAYNNNEFDKLPILKKSYDKKKADRVALRHLILPLIIKPGYIWDRLHGVTPKDIFVEEREI